MVERHLRHHGEDGGAGVGETGGDVQGVQSLMFKVSGLPAEAVSAKAGKVIEINDKGNTTE